MRGDTQKSFDLPCRTGHLIEIEIVHGFVIAHVVGEISLGSGFYAVLSGDEKGDGFRFEFPLGMGAPLAIVDSPFPVFSLAP